VEVVTMRAAQRFLKSFGSLLQRKRVNAAVDDIEVARQNTPPDERQAEYEEQLAEMYNVGTRCGKFALEVKLASNIH
jgi:hypothetical protein